ncbi:TPA: hypothetical protein IEP80_003450 [Escherichia coli]|nr:hypothetical protein [Escherichia coli]
MNTSFASLNWKDPPSEQAEKRVSSAPAAWLMNLPDLQVKYPNQHLRYFQCIQQVDSCRKPDQFEQTEHCQISGVGLQAIPTLRPG